MTTSNRKSPDGSSKAEEEKSLYDEIFDRVNEARHQLKNSNPLLTTLNQLLSAGVILNNKMLTTKSISQGASDKLKKEIDNLQQLISQLPALGVPSEAQKEEIQDLALLFISKFDSALIPLVPKVSQLDSTKNAIKTMADKIPIKNSKGIIEHSSITDLMTKNVLEANDSKTAQVGDPVVSAARKAKLALEEAGNPNNPVLIKLQEFIAAYDEHQFYLKYRRLLKKHREELQKILAENQNQEILTFEDFQAKAQQGDKLAARILRLIQPEGGKLRLPEELENRIKELRKAVLTPQLAKYKEKWLSDENKIKQDLEKWLKAIMSPNYLKKQVPDKNGNLIPNAVSIYAADKGGYGKIGRRNKFENLKKELSDWEKKSEWLEQVKAKINIYDLGAEKGKPESPEDSKLKVISILRPNGVEKLYEGTKSTPKGQDRTNKREDFVDALGGILADKTNEYHPKENEEGDKDPRKINPTKYAIKLKDLLGKEGFKLYKKAIKEEKNSKAFRDAVFLSSVEHYPGAKWKKRMLLWIAGPSGAGKSYAADSVVKLLSEMVMDKQANNMEGNRVAFIDGGIERKVSQMRQLVLQLALKKGWTGISDLHKNTELGIKNKIKEAALTTKDLSLAIPKTFANPNPLASERREVGTYDDDDTMEIFSGVTAAENQDETFKDSVARMQDSRAWSDNFDLEHTSNRIISMNNRDIGCESKLGEPQYFDAGKSGSNTTLEDYMKKSKTKICATITHDVICLRLDTVRNEWVKCDKKYKGHTIKMSARDFPRWQEYKNKGFQSAGFPSGLTHPQYWLDACRTGYALCLSSSLPASGPEPQKIYVDLKDGDLRYQYQLQGAPSEQRLTQKECLDLLGPVKTEFLFKALEKPTEDSLRPFLSDILKVSLPKGHPPKMENKLSPPLIQVKKNGQALTPEAKASTPPKQPRTAKNSSETHKGPGLFLPGTAAHPKTTIFATVSKIGESYLEKAKNGETNNFGRSFNSSDIGPEVMLWAKDTLQECGASKIEEAFSKAKIDTTSGEYSEKWNDHLDESLFDNDGNLAGWVKNLLPAGTEESFSIFLKKYCDCLGLLAFTPQGEIQPWVIQAIGKDNFKQVMDHSKLKLTEVLPQLSAGIEFILNEALLISSTQDASTAIQLATFLQIAAKFITHRQRFNFEFTSAVFELKKLKKQRHPDEGIELTINSAFNKAEEKMKELLTHPNMDITEIKEFANSALNHIKDETLKIKEAQRIVAEQSQSKPSPKPTKLAQSFSFLNPSPAAGLGTRKKAKPNILPKTRELTLKQQGKSIEATLTEHLSQQGNTPISDITKLSGSLNTSQILAEAAHNFKDFANGKPLNLFLDLKSARKFFANTIKDLRESEGSLSKASLQLAISENSPELTGEQLSMLAASLFKTYKNATEQFDPFPEEAETNDPYDEKSYHFPNDAFIRLAKHHVDSYMALCDEEKPEIVIGTDCWDPHYVDAVRLYCDMLDLPQPEYNSEKGWDVEPITPEKREAFRDLYNKHFADLDKTLVADYLPTTPKISGDTKTNKVKH